MPHTTSERPSQNQSAQNPSAQNPSPAGPSPAGPSPAGPSSTHLPSIADGRWAPSRRVRRSGRSTPARAAAAVVLVAGSLALAACGPAAEDSTTEESAAESATHSSAHGPSAGTTPPDASAEAGTTADGAHNDADVRFAAMMIPHHRQAVEMSETVLAQEDLPAAVRDLAERIEAAQAPEIRTMEAWLEDWGAAGAEHGGHAMDGMLTQEQLQELAEAEGQQAAELYLTGMIEHHRGAVEMAERELKAGRNAEALALAEQVIAHQSAEIEEMQALLAEGKH